MLGVTRSSGAHELLGYYHMQLSVSPAEEALHGSKHGPKPSLRILIDLVVVVLFFQVLLSTSVGGGSAPAPGAGRRGHDHHCTQAAMQVLCSTTAR